MIYYILGIRPVVCGRNICIMGYEDLGVGIDLQREVIANPLIIDLFISLLYFGLRDQMTKRLNLMFPSSVKSYDSNGQELSFISTVSIKFYYYYSIMNKINLYLFIRMH